MPKKMFSKIEKEVIFRMLANNCSSDVIAYRTGININDINRCIGNEKNKFFKINAYNNKFLSIPKKKIEIIELFKLGYNISNISLIENINTDRVKDILADKGLIEPRNEIEIITKFPDGVNTSDIYNFRNNLKIGEKYRIYISIPKMSHFYIKYTYKQIDVKVLKKYPYIVMTDQGTFQYIDLLLGHKLES